MSIEMKTTAVISQYMYLKTDIDQEQEEFQSPRKMPPVKEQEILT